jgi:hypothetical protein
MTFQCHDIANPVGNGVVDLLFGLGHGNLFRSRAARLIASGTRE